MNGGDTQIRKVLDNVPLLENLSGSQRAMVAKRMWVEEFGDGQLIIAEGDIGDSFYVIESGAPGPCESNSSSQLR